MPDDKNKLHLKSATEIKVSELLSRPSVEPLEVLDLVKSLKNELSFGFARRLLQHCLKFPATPPSSQQMLKLAQELSVCTYKNPDLPPQQRLDEAFSILNEADPLDLSKNQETLGQAGAIYKRKWELGNHKQHLERSLAYYRRGYNQYNTVGWAVDYGYTAVNTAYLLDRLASLESTEAVKAGTSSETAAQRYAESERIRKEIVEKLPPLVEANELLNFAWWFLVTIGEALFGLGRYDDALFWLKKADALEGVPSWERESTARQLSSLLQLRIQRGVEFVCEADNAKRVLKEFLGEHAAESVMIGKIGLALSGGGFRASLYHIGVLARLAELDVLRHVEVLSCVSGGSIIGAHYYLEVRNLLQSTPQNKITPQHYINIVKKIEKDFLDGVQTNIRTSVAANLIKIIRMVITLDYSRTNRLGELYEERLFSKVDGIKRRYMDELIIRPVDEDGQFTPKHHNWKRSAKVPILILNATTLNTGHNWQFTASWMGEPPAGIDSEIDANDRLRRMYYEEAPDGLKNIRLGDAVAASSCVPGLFEPLPLAGLYPDRTVRLVDGGVHDNQGSAGLLEQNCSVMLVSDASGQMSSEKQPGSSTLGVVLRSKSILEERVRIAQYHELDARRRSSLLQGLMFIHLKKELDGDLVDWIDCKEPSSHIDNNAVTTYGINKDYQLALSRIRTDLDSFTDNEAYSLMLSGYRMTERYFPISMPNWTPPTMPMPVKWQFMKLDDELCKKLTNEKLLTQLQISKLLAFKVWMLDPDLNILAKAFGFTTMAYIVYLCLTSREKVILCIAITVGTVALPLLGIVINRFVGENVWKYFNYRKTLKEIGVGIVLLVAGWLVAQIHLNSFDRLYLLHGKEIK